MDLSSNFWQEVDPKMVVRAVAQLYGKRTHFRQKKTEKFWFWNSGFLSARIGFVASSVFDFFMLRFFIFSEAKLFKNHSCFLFVFFVLGVASSPAAAGGIPCPRRACCCQARWFRCTLAPASLPTARRTDDPFATPPFRISPATLLCPPLARLRQSTKKNDFLKMIIFTFENTSSSVAPLRCVSAFSLFSRFFHFFIL